MPRDHLLLSFRALTKDRSFTFLNVFGMAIGLSVCLMILIYVRYETSYDAALPASDRLYQLKTTWEDPSDHSRNAGWTSSYAARVALEQDFPQVERIAFVMRTRPTVIEHGEATRAEDVLLVDSRFFDMFEYPFITGSAATALATTGSLVVTESEALKRFGTLDILGRTLTLRDKETIDYRITGVVADPPRNSNLAFTMVGRVDFARRASAADLKDWNWQSGWVFARLKPGTDVTALHDQLPAWERRHIPDVMFEGRLARVSDYVEFELVNIRDVHLNATTDGAVKPGNSPRTIATFAIVAAMILFMASVNFINLSTARAHQRAREVALRKLVGAQRRQLVVQFLGESVALTAIAMLIAIAIVEVSLPTVRSFLDADLALDYRGGGVLTPAAALTLVAGIGGGLCPAFHLSSFRPATVLKSGRALSESPGAGRLRNALVVLQFAVSIGLMTCTAIVYAQTVYARSADPGFRHQGILQIGNIGRKGVGPGIDAVMREIGNLDGVEGVARSGLGIGSTNNFAYGFVLPDGEPSSFETYSVDASYFGLLEVPLVAGRSFDAARTADDATLPESDAAAEAAIAARGVNIIANASAVERMGFRDAGDAIGKQVKVAMLGDGGTAPATIIGVVGDTRLRSIHQPIEPTFYLLRQTGHDVLLVKYDGQPNEMLGRIEAAWRRVVPDVPFEARFAEDIIDDLYDAEEARAQLFAFFALLSIAVACLGIVGLAAFAAARRTREIGIRKALGARTADIVRLLVWQFVKPVLLANIVAWPLAWWAMQDWLNGFDVRIGLSPLPFLLSGALAIFIASAVIAGQSARVARTSPAHALRYE